MTWGDHETGSLWSQPNGLALAGPRAGDQLELLPSSLSTWADWQSEHPLTLALDVDNGPDGFRLEQLAVVVSFGDDALAYPFPRLQREQVVNSVVGDVALAVVSFEDDEGWSVLSRTLNAGEVVELEVRGNVLGEVGGDRTWDPVTGLTLDTDGQNLNILPSLTSFPRDYVRFFQNGAIWLPTGLVSVAGCSWDQGTDASNLRGLVECDSREG